MLNLIPLVFSLFNKVASYFRDKQLLDAGEMRAKAKQARKAMIENAKAKRGAESNDSDYNTRVRNKYTRRNTSSK